MRTHIGFPSPDLTDDHAAHRLAFGEKEITRAKAAMGVPDEPFWVPAEVLDYYRSAGAKGASESEAWDGRLKNSSKAAEWATAWGSGLDDGWQAVCLSLYRASRSPPARPANMSPRALKR